MYERTKTVIPHKKNFDNEKFAIIFLNLHKYNSTLKLRKERKRYTLSLNLITKYS